MAMDSHEGHHSRIREWGQGAVPPKDHETGKAELLHFDLRRAGIPIVTLISRRYLHTLSVPGISIGCGDQDTPIA